MILLAKNNLVTLRMVQELGNFGIYFGFWSFRKWSGLEEFSLVVAG